MARKVAEGVYLHREELRTTGDSAVVGVHLMYRQFDKNIDLFSGSGNYFSNLAGFFKNTGSKHVFLFEQRGALGGIPVSSAKLISEMRESSEGIYIIPTVLHGPCPDTPFWQGPLRFIEDFCSKVSIVGGRVNVCKDGIYTNCAGAVYEDLKSLGLELEFVEGCCFT